MQQSWHDLLFAHWPVEVDKLHPLIPPQLTIDTFDGTAWVGVVPFRMSGVRPCGLPSLPWISSFPELNVRTYVTVDTPRHRRPGVYFFSLEAGNPLAVTIARRLYKLPYYRAEMQLDDRGNTIDYSSHRTHDRAPLADFVGTYGPTGGIHRAAQGSLEHWLTERYCLYVVDRDSRAFRGEIHHLPWPLQEARAEIQVNTMAAAAGIQLPDTQPLLHFTRRLDVLVWGLQRVTV
jgi:uncharacterized protein YqjF (DUF2071 family)